MSTTYRLLGDDLAAIRAEATRDAGDYDLDLFVDDAEQFELNCLVGEEMEPGDFDDSEGDLDDPFEQ